MILCFRNKLIQIIQNGKLSLAIFIQVNLNMWDSFINRSFTVNFNRWICLNQTPFNEPLDCNNLIQLYTWWWALTENVNGSFSEVCPNRINYLVSVGIWLKGVVSSHLICFVLFCFCFCLLPMIRKTIGEEASTRKTSRSDVSLYFIWPKVSSFHFIKYDCSFVRFRLIKSEHCSIIFQLVENCHYLVIQKKLSYQLPPVMWIEEG